MITLRRSTSADAEKVFEWRNDDETRAVSRSSQAVTWDDHAAWFADRLMTEHAESVWIVERDGVPAGSGRINRYEDDDRAEISIVLAREHRNRGVGRDAIKQLADRARSMGCVPVAFVRPENRRSLNTFLSAGFRFSESLVELHST
jgi:RimJ/RimL family protein N-acetyltransferase